MSTAMALRPRIGERANSTRWCRTLLLVTAMSIVAFAGGCSSDSAVSTGPTQLKCQVALAASSSNIGADGGTGIVTVTTSPECPWAVSTGANWLSGLSPTAGQGTGTVEFRAAPNPLPSVREGEIVVNDNRLRVSQQAAACRVELRSGSFTIDAGGGSREVGVSAPGGCSWTASTDANWISFATPVTGAGDGTVGVSIAPNGANERRTGTIIVGDQRLTVTQEPGGSVSGCVYVISSASQAVLPSGGAEVSASVTVASGCAWTASSSVAWVTILAGASGTGSGAVAFSVAANPGGVRTGTVTVAGQTFTVTQAGATTGSCTYTIGPPDVAIAAPGGSGTVAVSTNAGCEWTASSNAAWITITSRPNGSGTGAVTFGVAPNPGAARTGTISIAGHAFTVNQAGAATANPCNYTINPREAALAAAGGSGAVAVTAGDGCQWTANSTANWITVTSGASGTGNGSVGFSVAPNPGTIRTGTITVADKTFTVMQSALPCTNSISPASLTVPAAGGTGTVAVSAESRCAWTARSEDGWIKISSGSSGNGNGTVTFIVADHKGKNGRTGTITVAGQTVTVQQAGEPEKCDFKLAPKNTSFGALGGSGAVAVTAGATCAWTATSNAAWITITSGANGTGDGAVAFSVAVNLLGARTGTITVAGENFTVNQAAVLGLQDQAGDVGSPGREH